MGPNSASKRTLMHILYVQVICEIRAELGHVQRELAQAKKYHVNVSIENAHSVIAPLSVDSDWLSCRRVHCTYVSSGWRFVWRNSCWPRGEADQEQGGKELRYQSVCVHHQSIPYLYDLNIELGM